MKLPPLALRIRIVIALLALTLGTALALSYVTRNVLDRSLNISINNEVRSTLFGALSVAKSSYNDRRETLRRLGERLAHSPAATAAFHTGDLPLLRRLVAGQEDGTRISEVAAIPFVQGRPPSVEDLGALISSEDLTESLRNGPYLYRDEKQRDLLKMLVPVRDGDRIAGVLSLSERLDPTYITIEQAVQTYEDIGQKEQAIRKAHLYAFLAVAFGVLLLAALVGVWIAFGITTPLRDLIRGTEELARDNLSHRIPRHRDDEIGLLIDSFNRMAADLQENRRQRVEVEKVAAWREIARRLAHEIKNPLTPIQLTVQQMRDKYTGEDKVYRKLLDDCADIVTDEVESLKNLVRAFADFARLPDLKVAPTDVNALVDEVSRLYADAPLTLNLAEDLPLALVDEAQMRRVLINLIENAEDALGEGGRITITTRNGETEKRRNGDSPIPRFPDSPAPGWVEVEVADTGQGISPAHLSRIFEAYFSTKRTGMGLGLAIVKNIIEQHGGQIAVESRVREGRRSGESPEEGGATFVICLPGVVKK
ncbi:MAG: HAMP domain-containing protein [Candidatus Latescibacteria bacterium]|nr:HAMP domain-containing protein [Candidatus Latescibacterota bacterium]